MYRIIAREAERLATLYAERPANAPASQVQDMIDDAAAAPVVPSPASALADNAPVVDMVRLRGYRLTRLQGEWVVVEVHFRGQKTPQTSRTTLRVSGDVWTFSNDGNAGSTWKVRLDPSASPRRADLCQEGSKDPMILGIYRFDGGQLYFCYEVGTRPTKFDTSGGCWMMVMSRR